ncbi:hypothetical protein GCM10012283_16190 [Phycicoccus endophyticus]|nr:hypothetical protein GCM10012283_16190 [Phycicoccus endophyticus]
MLSDAGEQVLTGHCRDLTPDDDLGGVEQADGVCERPTEDPAGVAHQTDRVRVALRDQPEDLGRGPNVLPCGAQVPLDGPGAGVRLHAAGLAAPAQGLLPAMWGFAAGVPEVSGGSVGTPDETASCDEAGPYPGAHLDEDQLVGRWFGGDVLTPCHRVGVVLD